MLESGRGDSGTSWEVAATIRPTSSLSPVLWIRSRGARATDSGAPSMTSPLAGALTGEWRLSPVTAGATSPPTIKRTRSTGICILMTRRISRPRWNLRRQFPLLAQREGHIPGCLRKRARDRPPVPAQECHPALSSRGVLSRIHRARCADGRGVPRSSSCSLTASSAPAGL